MAEPIRIEVASAAEGKDLIDMLARRGLIGELVHVDGQWVVEISSPREETEPLLTETLETLVALETWLAGREEKSVTVRVGERTYRVAPRT